MIEKELACLVAGIRLDWPAGREALIIQTNIPGNPTEIENIFMIWTTSLYEQFALSTMVEFHQFQTISTGQGLSYNGELGETGLLFPRCLRYIALTK